MEPDVVVGEVKVQLVQLVVGADVGELMEGLQGEGLAAAVEHEAALGVLRPVLGLAAREGVALVREDLEDGAGAPEGTEGRGRLDDDAALARGEGVALRVGLVIGNDAQEDVAGLGALGGEGDGAPEAGSLADEREAKVVGKGLGVTGEGVAGVLGNDDAGVLGQLEGPGIGVVAPIPELGDDEGLRAPSGRRRHQHRGEECRFHTHSIALSRGSRPAAAQLFLPACPKTQGLGAARPGERKTENGERKGLPGWGTADYAVFEQIRGRLPPAGLPEWLSQRAQGLPEWGTADYADFEQIEGVLAHAGQLGDYTELR